MKQEKNRKLLKSVVVRISGDSGDGIQLAGTQFSNAVAYSGNIISTFPDFPAEIRAPAGTLAGISGFQLQFSDDIIYTPGDKLDILFAMNPAALKSNLKDLNFGGILIINIDSFTSVNLKKANYDFNPIEENYLNNYRVIKININNILRDSLAELSLNNKDIDRGKNFFSLGVLHWLYDIKIEYQKEWIKNKFKNNELLLKSNLISFLSGYTFSENSELFQESYSIAKSNLNKGIYRSITGNNSIVLGILYTLELSKLKAFYSGYPITPASDILHELSKYLSDDIIIFQAEDEISAICACIGSSYTGKISLTATSGPGMSLKTEAIGLAIMLETPLIIIDVQRAGPSTGMPTKVEQSDILQSFYGRHGDTNIPILCPSSPVDCFFSIIEAIKISIKFMTPVIFLSDSYIANTSELWNVSEIEKKNIDFSFLSTHIINTDMKADILLRDNNLVKKWILFGTKNNEYRIGGLERDFNTGVVSTESNNHEILTKNRFQKINNILKEIEIPSIYGHKAGDLLLISFGSSYGAIKQATDILIKGGIIIGYLNFKWLNPLHENILSFLKSFKKKMVLELNNGQFVKVLRDKYLIDFIEYNKIQGQPFKVSEILFIVKNLISKK